MFTIKLIDIMGDKKMVEFTTYAETLETAEQQAIMEIESHINATDVTLRHEHSLVYTVRSGGQSIGAVVIKTK